MLTYAATGHRPNKLGGYSEAVFDRLVEIAAAFMEDRRPSKVISGMALGWDQAWAQAAVLLGIPFIAAIPFDGQELLWPSASQGRFNSLLNYANEVVTVSKPGYAAHKMQIRNEWMVNRCDELVALWDGSPGGTANCVSYAKECDVPITNLWPLYTLEAKIVRLATEIKAYTTRIQRPG